MRPKFLQHAFELKSLMCMGLVHYLFPHWRMCKVFFKKPMILMHVLLLKT